MSFLHYKNGELDTDSIIPLVDGGTEGFKGNVRVIIPGMTACVECTLELYPPQVIATSRACICLFVLNFLNLFISFPSVVHNVLNAFFWFCSPAHTGQFSHVYYCIYAQTAGALY